MNIKLRFEDHPIHNLNHLSKKSIRKSNDMGILKSIK